MVYQVQSAIWVQARLIKQGTFPGWSPYSQGGSPLIGKMQNAVFAPNHLPFYVFPSSWMPYLFMLVLALKYYLAFAFAYLYTRCLGIDLFGGIFSGTLFLFSEVAGGQIFSWGSSGLYLPLLLLIVELYFRASRRLAQFLLPWAVALPFLSGHFESAFYVDSVTGVYFLAHLWNEKPQPAGAKAGQLARFLGLMLLGAIIAGPQIVPAVEYVAQSYNKIWHNPEWFGFWQYETIGKHLSGEDAPLLIAGMAGLLAFAALLRGCLRTQADPLAPRELARKSAAALLLAFTIACLANLGMDDSLKLLSFSGQSSDLLNWLVSFLLLLFSFWGWRQDGQPYGLKILGFILIGSILIILRTPPFSNILLHLPLFGNFHNTSHRWEYRLILGVLCAAAFQRMALRGREPLANRLKTTINVLGITCVFLFGFIASQPFKGALARLVPTGLPPASQDQDSRSGGIMGPERQTTYSRRQTVAGWVTALPPVSSISIGLVQGNRITSSVDATASASASGNRLYFDATVDLPSKPGLASILARIVRSDGTEKLLRGAELEIDTLGKSPTSFWWLIAGLAVAPLAFLCGAPLLKALPILILAFSMKLYKAQAIPADQIPYRLPGIDKVKEDQALFRVSSLRYDFLQADYTNVYGLSDLRTGGDNLDVLTMIYFSHLYNHFLGNAQDPSALETGLGLLGLANVKYLVDLPGAAPSHPGMEPFYQGSDISVFRNKRMLPRAAFYSRYAYIPMRNWRDWKARDKFLGPIAGLLGQKALDMGNTLLLNDLPSLGFEPATKKDPVNSSVRVDEYAPDQVRLSVETDRPGFVFLSDNHFPGWEARLNGKKTKILRSWITFRAVEVPAGKSSVTFSYRPLPLWAAAFASVGISLAWLWLYRRHRLGAPSASVAAPADPAPKRKKQPLPPSQDDGLEALGACGAAAEWIVLSLIGSALLFWAVWSAFIYQGGIQSSWSGGRGLFVNAAGCAFLAVLSFASLADFFGTIKRPQTQSEERSQYDLSHDH